MPHRSSIVDDGDSLSKQIKPSVHVVVVDWVARFEGMSLLAWVGRTLDRDWTIFGRRLSGSCQIASQKNRKTSTLQLHPHDTFDTDSGKNALLKMHPKLHHQKLQARGFARGLVVVLMRVSLGCHVPCCLVIRPPHLRVSSSRCGSLLRSRTTSVFVSSNALEIETILLHTGVWRLPSSYRYSRTCWVPMINALPLLSSYNLISLFTRPHLSVMRLGRFPVACGSHREATNWLNPRVTSVSCCHREMPIFGLGPNYLQILRIMASDQLGFHGSCLSFDERETLA